MSCTFWLRRKKLAAKKKESTPATEQIVSVTEKKETTGKPVKRAVKKNDNGTV